MSRSSLPIDGKETYRKAGIRHAEQSGQPSIHGMTLWDVQTQEGQSLGFFSGMGQGTDGTSTGSGRMVMNTPGLSMEVCGYGLKSGQENNPGKYIHCKHGDVWITADDGDIVLQGKNVRIFADGAAPNGDFTVNANKVANIKSPDIRLQGEKIAINGSNQINIVSEGFFELKYSFLAAVGSGDMTFGSLSGILASMGLSVPGL